MRVCSDPITRFHNTNSPIINWWDLKTYPNPIVESDGLYYTNLLTRGFESVFVTFLLGQQIRGDTGLLNGAILYHLYSANSA